MFQSRSFVVAFLQLLYCRTTSLDDNIIDITNTSRTLGFNPGEPYAACGHPGLDSGMDQMGYGKDTADIYTPYPIPSDEVGIIVGTSDTAVAVLDDNLVSPVSHGTAAGELVYYGCYGLNFTTGASSASFDIERIFRNDSGGGITIKEIGLYVNATTQGDDPVHATSQKTVFSFCVLRDVIAPTVTVADTEYLKVKYTITVSN